MPRYRNPIDILNDEKHRLTGAYVDINIKKIKSFSDIKKSKTLEKQVAKINKAIEILKTFKDEF